MVDGYVARFKDEVHSFAFVDEGISDASPEHRDLVGMGIHLLKVHVLSSRDGAHTSVFGVGAIDREPKGDNFHRLEGPIAAVLMPKYGLAVEWRLADVMAGEEGDVGADILFCNI